MKGIKYLVILALVAMFGASWYSLYSNSAKAQAAYEENLAMARKKAEMGIVSDAEQYYKTAYEMHGNMELRVEIAEFYLHAGLLEQFEIWCGDMVEEHPKDKEGYVLLAEYYQDCGDIEKCYEIIFSAGKRKIQSETLEQLDQNLAYRYDLSFGGFPEVGIWNNGFRPVYDGEGLGGYLDEDGTQVISYSYQKAGYFMSNGYAPVQNKAGECSLIDSGGNKKFVDVENKKLEECGPFNEDKMAVKINGKYCYVDKEFHVLFGNYDFAGTYNGGFAPVRNQDKWMLVDDKGEAVGNETYEDIKLDELSLGIRKGIMFVKQDGSYRMKNLVSNTLADSKWEDVKQFSNDEWTCFQKDGKWGFIDLEGKEVIKAQYEDAMPFSFGLAAVRIHGKWGYINKKNELVIPADFDGARDFTSNGVTFVKGERGWQSLRLLRGSIKE